MTTEAAVLLEVSGLHVDFDVDGTAVTAVRNASFRVGRGEIVAIVGESGSGKSVSALATLGLLERTATVRGSIAFEGTELVGAPDAVKGLRGRHVAMIFQDPVASLDPVFTIGFQLTETIRAHDPSLGRAAARARALELLRAVDIPEPEAKLRQYPHQLSGGQCQRVMIALALVTEPELLIADEPTTALDVSVQEGILDLLHELRDRVGTAVLIITHDMGVVADIADRVVVMRAGEIVETGEAGRVFAGPADAYTRELLAAVPRVGARVESVRDTAPAEGGAVLEIDRLSVDYRRPGTRQLVRVVHEVSLSIAPGEVLALVGESGSGKSTVARASIGLTPIADGRIVMNGRDVATLARAERTALRHRVGVVFQNPATSLNPRYSIGETVAEPLRAIRGMRGQQLQDEVIRLLDLVGIAHAWTSRLPHELSGGQRQRVAIARALSLGPELLVADEPTSALDVTVQALVLDTLRSLQRELGFACLFISHDLAVVDSLADRVAVMRAGRVIELAERGELFARPQDAYTKTLLEAAPVPDPAEQRLRREARLAATAQLGA